MSALADFQASFVQALRRPNAHHEMMYGAGLRVYQNTVMTGLMEVLRANYPTVELLVGAEWFAGVARLYARDHLPVEPSLALYGEEFVTFLQTFAGAQELPYLTPVARLDRLWTETHFAANATVLQAESLTAFDAEQLSSLRLALHPAARFAWLPHSAVTIWRANRPPAQPPEELQIDDAEEGVLLVRPGGAVEVIALTQDETRFGALLSRHPLGEAAEQMLALSPTANIAAMWAKFIHAGAFQACADQGLP